MKGALDGLLAANKREQIMRYLRKLDGKSMDWVGINKHVYLSGIAAHVGQIEIDEENFTRALECFDFALDIFKQIKGSKSEVSPMNDPSTKILLFTILHSIAHCFYEDGEFERSKFFNKKVFLIFFRKKTEI